MAYPLVGTPQFLQVKGFLYSGSGATEVDASTNGQVLSVGNQTKTITAGPTTTGPVFVGVNGTMWSLPFNQAASAPGNVWAALDSSVWTAA